MFAKKAFGQNFLRDETILDEIVRIINPQPTDVVLEVGSGRGALTRELLSKSKRVIGVEFDRDLIPVLKSEFGSNPLFELVAGDILSYIPSLPDQGFKLAGNIPYNLTTKLFEKILLWPVKPASITFLIQKEVAEKITQKGAKNSPLAICAEILGKAEIRLIVPPHAFEPMPKVTSAVISIDCSQGKPVEYPFEFYDFAHKIFRMPRKTIYNNLIAYMEKADAEKILGVSRIDPKSRPESLNFEELRALFSTASIKR